MESNSFASHKIHALQEVRLSATESSQVELKWAKSQQDKTRELETRKFDKTSNPESNCALELSWNQHTQDWLNPISFLRGRVQIPLKLDQSYKSD